MKRCVAVVTGIVGLLVGLVLLTGTSGRLAHFSPHTLEYQAQSEFTVLGGAFPVYWSPRRDADNELVTLIRQDGFVAAERPRVQRWELIAHSNHAWRDGFGPLYDVFIRHRREIIEWSKADPDRARVYWSEGFKHLRSDTKAGVRTGRQILISCWRAQTTQELREQIAAVTKEVAEEYE